MSRERRRGWYVPRLSSVLFTLLIVLAAATSVVAVRVPSDGGSQIRTAISEEIPPSLPGNTHPALLLIGDSYTQGPSTSDLSYGCQAATELGWDCNVAAQGGTGYVSGGPGQRLSEDQYGRRSTSFVERLPRLRQLYRADVVILDGGRNDLQFDMFDVLRAFSYTVAQVIDTWPNSRIVVIAPWLIAEPALRPGAFGGDTIGHRFWSALRSSRAFDRVDLIDPAALDWFVGADLTTLSDDGIQPNSRGDQIIADLLTDALVKGGIVSPA